MKCSHCGYLMDAFDTECPKCHGKAGETGQQNALAKSPLQPEPAITIPTPSAQPAPPISPAPVPAPSRKLMLSCPVCDSENVQKVSALVEAGTEHSSSSGTTTGYSANLGHVFGGGNFGMVGVNTAKNNTSHTSHTSLANRLRFSSGRPLPPKPEAPPAYQEPQRKAERQLAAAAASFLMCAAIIGFFYASGVRMSWNWVLFWLFIPIMVTCVLFMGGAANYLGEAPQRRAAEAARRQREVELVAWNQNSAQILAKWERRCKDSNARLQRREANWNRLYYCHRSIRADGDNPLNLRDSFSIRSLSKTSQGRDIKKSRHRTTQILLEVANGNASTFGTGPPQPRLLSQRTAGMGKQSRAAQCRFAARSRSRYLGIAASVHDAVLAPG
jgi:hypothetical protein